MRVRVDLREVAALERDPRVLEAVDDQVATPLAARMAARAPKDSGAGAASIHSEPLPDGAPGFGVGWTPENFPLGFVELGTEDQLAAPFARPAADEFRSSR